MRSGVKCCVSCDDEVRATTDASGIAARSLAPDRIAELEAVRSTVVRTVLEKRAACETAKHEGSCSDRDIPIEDWPVQQQLLSAAVEDLKDLDEVLHELRANTRRA